LLDREGDHVSHRAANVCVDFVMRRSAAALTIAFVASLVVAAYGHCWPMFTAQMHHAVTTQNHPGHEHGHGQGKHPSLPQEQGPELVNVGVASGPQAVLTAPLAKPAPGIPFMVTALPADDPGAKVPQLYNGARAGPFAFRDIHARTGRLLI
jgi:hypothetical protein